MIGATGEPMREAIPIAALTAVLLVGAIACAIAQMKRACITLVTIAIIGTAGAGVLYWLGDRHYHDCRETALSDNSDGLFFGSASNGGWADPPAAKTAEADNCNRSTF